MSGSRGVLGKTSIRSWNSGVAVAVAGAAVGVGVEVDVDADADVDVDVEVAGVVHAWAAGCIGIG